MLPSIRILVGTNSDDTLFGKASNDILFGKAGNDTLFGKAGDDILSGGSGNDSLTGGGGIDLLVEAGNVNFTLSDSQLVGLGTDTLSGIEQVGLTGGNGNNRFNAITFTLGSVYFKGGAGNDTLVGGNGNDFLIGEKGDDYLEGSEGEDYLNGGAGDDELYDTEFENQGDLDILIGGSGNDYLYGGAALMSGGVGNDMIDNSGIGGSSLLGGEGDDWIQGEGGDALSGGSGDDTLEGFRSNGKGIISDGGDGNDTASYQGFGLTNGVFVSLVTGTARAFDQLPGKEAVDTLRSIENLTGSAYPDRLVGDEKNNYLDGGTGSALANDTLEGKGGNDTLLGNDGNDILSGGPGDDQLVGGPQLLLGRTDADRLTGGAGADHFVFNAKTEEKDTITDFSVVDDTIQVSKAGFGGGLTSNKVITAAQFKLGTGAADTSDRVIYNKNTGGLFFDVDGKGGAGQVQFAQLSTGLAMTSNDIFVIA